MSDQTGNGNGGTGEATAQSFELKVGLAEMLKGGVIMDVTTAEQAKIAEAAGAVAVMALERVPADIRAQGGVARMADPGKVKEIQNAVSIPVMAKVRIGHFAEAQVLDGIESWAPMAITSGRLIVRDLTKMKCLDVGEKRQK